jgi:N-acyl-D-amino-acid deacylase
LKADVVLFDPAQIRDPGTFKDPERYATGVDWVWVNGTPVIEKGEPTGALAGKVLLGPGAKR